MPKIFTGFRHTSLKFQFLFVITTLLLIPALVMLYDIYFATKSDEAMLRDRELKLGALVETKVIPEFTSNLKEKVGELSLYQLDPEIRQNYMQSAFAQVAEPLTENFPGVRFGLYLSENKQIYIQGFLHEYRMLSEEETRNREKRILTEVDSGLLAVSASQRPLSKLTSSLNDETFEYLSPVLMDGQLIGVVWADERLHPIFAQSRSFRLLIRYITLLGFFVGATGAIIVIHNLASTVSVIKKGLSELEQDVNRQLPEMPGELGQISQAINKMAAVVAEKEKLEEELRRSERLASLGRLVTGVAHELRNPIGVVKATVQVMEAEYKNISGIEEFTQVIKDEVDRQNRVIQELLNFGRPSKPLVQKVFLNSLLEKVLTFTAPMLRQDKIDLVKNLDSNLNYVHADPERIKQVFVNMIINAQQAMPQGGYLKISTYRQNGKACVEFADNGSGIDSEQLGQVFEPFYTTKEQGTGLGLSISYQIIKSHGGTIDVSSGINVGSSFIVCLPFPESEGGNL